MLRNYVSWGAIAMLLAVALGAFGAHGLEDKLADNLMSAYQTGVQYHIAHALGLIVIGLAAGKLGESKWLSRAGLFMWIGIVLFSGSLYVMAVTGITKLGIITPFGGVSFMLGWLFLALAARKSNP